jgi:hypothetical protein
LTLLAIAGYRAIFIVSLWRGTFHPPRYHPKVYSMSFAICYQRSAICSCNLPIFLRSYWVSIASLWRSRCFLAFIVTLIGWITLIRSIVLLFLPLEAIDRFVKTIRYEQNYYVFAGIALVLGAYLTFADFREITVQKSHAKAY